MNKTVKISALSLSILLLGAGAVQQAAAADEHGRPEAAHAERPQPRGTAPGFDGRGQVLDSRYNHGRYYPPMGAVRPSLPEGYRPYYRGGSRFYFSGGIWYAPSGPGFIVVRPPTGLVISVLPPFYSTLWFGGVPYYYANNVYYSWQPDQNGYAVVDPPENADAPSAPPDLITASSSKRPNAPAPPSRWPPDFAAVPARRRLNFNGPANGISKKPSRTWSGPNWRTVRSLNALTRLRRDELPV